MFYVIIKISRAKMMMSNKNMALTQLSRIKEMVKYQKKVKKQRKESVKRRKTQ